MSKIGIDIGGTSVKGILLSDNNEIIKEFTHPTYGKEGREVILKSVFTVIDGLFDDGVNRIGVSSAGNINPFSGVCVYATDNLKGFTGLDLKSVIETRYGVKTSVDNDAICALKAEARNYESQNVVMITFGTGIGCGVLSGGNIIRGKNFDGGRLGHLTLVPGGRPCNCGKQGCAEAYLSCTALAFKSKEQFGYDLSTKDLFRLYKEKNITAIEILDEFSYYLNVFLDNVRTAYAPDVIVLGGGLCKDAEILLSLIKVKDDIRFAKYDNNAGALGALIDEF